MRQHRLSRHVIIPIVLLLVVFHISKKYIVSHQLKVSCVAVVKIVQIVRLGSIPVSLLSLAYVTSLRSRL